MAGRNVAVADDPIELRAEFRGEITALAGYDSNLACVFDLFINEFADPLNFAVIAAHALFHDLLRDADHVGVAELAVGFDRFEQMHAEGLQFPFRPLGGINANVSSFNGFVNGLRIINRPFAEVLHDEELHLAGDFLYGRFQSGPDVEGFHIRNDDGFFTGFHFQTVFDGLFDALLGCSHDFTRKSSYVKLHKVYGENLCESNTLRFGSGHAVA